MGRGWDGLLPQLTSCCVAQFLAGWYPFVVQRLEKEKKEMLPNASPRASCSEARQSKTLEFGAEKVVQEQTGRTRVVVAQSVLQESCAWPEIAILP